MSESSNQISITWDGSEWQVEASVPTSRIRPDQTLSISIPDEALLPEPADGPVDLRMFARETFLYVPIANPTQRREELEANFESHKRDARPPWRVTPPPNMAVIKLLEDVELVPPTNRLSGVECRVVGLDSIFQSVNSAASHCVLRYNQNAVGAIGVFLGVRFLHTGNLIVLNHMRQFLLHGTPLPTQDDDDQTPSLFEDLQ